MASDASPQLRPCPEGAPSIGYFLPTELWKWVREALQWNVEERFEFVERQEDTYRELDVYLMRGSECLMLIARFNHHPGTLTIINTHAHVEAWWEVVDEYRRGEEEILFFLDSDRYFVVETIDGEIMGGLDHKIWLPLARFRRLFPSLLERLLRFYQLPEWI